MGNNKILEIPPTTATQQQQPRSSSRSQKTNSDTNSTSCLNYRDSFALTKRNSGGELMRKTRCEARIDYQHRTKSGGAPGGGSGSPTTKTVPITLKHGGGRANAKFFRRFTIPWHWHTVKHYYDNYNVFQLMMKAYISIIEPPSSKSFRLSFFSTNQNMRYYISNT